MAKFRGEIGYGETVESSPGSGKFVLQVHEVKKTGDLLRNSQTQREADKVNDDIVLQHSISIVADSFLSERMDAIRYVKMAGTYWKVAEVTIERPRLILRLGGVYSGKKA